MIKLALVGFLSAMASIAMADDANPTPDKIEEIHEDWSEWVLGTANKIDGFFSNSQADEDAQKTRIRGWIQGQYDENEGSKVRLRVRARVSLPNTENRISLVIGDDQDEQTLDPANEDQQNVSLQFRSRRDTALKTVRFDLGIRRRDSQYQLYGRARHTKIFETASTWVPRLTNSFYYFTKSRFEYRGEAQFDRVLGKTFSSDPLQCFAGMKITPTNATGDGVTTSFLASISAWIKKSQQRWPMIWNFISEKSLNLRFLIRSSKLGIGAKRIGTGCSGRLNPGSTFLQIMTTILHSGSW